MGKSKKIPIWNSLAARHGERGFFHDPSRATLQWHLYYGTIGAIFGFLAWLTRHTLYAYVFLPTLILCLVFFYHQFFYLDEPTNKQFLIVYEDEIVLGASEMSWGPGMVRLPRNEYKVEVIARDAEVYDMEKCNEYYVAVFNKPVRGTNFVRMNNIEFNVTSETVRKVASILNADKVLLDGYYYPTVYAVFKMICGDEAPDLAEALLKDYTEEVEKYGHWKVSALMNALRSLCLAKKKKEAIKLAEMIATGKAFEKLDKIDEKEYIETWFEPGKPCYPNNQKRNKADRMFDIVSNANIYSPAILFALSFLAIPWFGLIVPTIAFVALASVIVHGFGFYTAAVWSRNRIGDGYFKVVFVNTLPYDVPYVLFLLPALTYPLPPPFWQIYFLAPAVPLPAHIVFLLAQTQYFAYKTGLKHAEKLLL